MSLLNQKPNVTVHAWQLQMLQWLGTFCLEINHIISSSHVYIEVTMLYAHPEIC